MAGIREASGTRRVYFSIPGTNSLPYIYYCNESGTNAVIPRDDSGLHGVETLTPGTPLLVGVRGAGGPYPMGARRFSKLICHYLIDLLLILKQLYIKHGSPSAALLGAAQQEKIRRARANFCACILPGTITRDANEKKSIK